MAEEAEEEKLAILIREPKAGRPGLIVLGRTASLRFMNILGRRGPLADSLTKGKVRGLPPVFVEQVKRGGTFGSPTPPKSTVITHRLVFS